MPSNASPLSLSPPRRAIVATGLVAALISSVAVTASPAIAVDTVPVITISDSQTEIQVDRVLTLGGDDDFGFGTTSSSRLQVSFENLTDTPETYGLAADMETKGVEQRAWLPETFGEGFEGVEDIFSVGIDAHSTGRSQWDGYLPDWPGETYGFYRIAVDGVDLAMPELVGSFTNAGTWVRFSFADEQIGQLATFDDPQVYQGADTIARASGLTPGEQLGLWLSPGIDYFSFMITGARLAEDAVYVGEGFVAADGTLTASLAVPPDLSADPTYGTYYQLLVGNAENRNWPAGSTSSIKVVVPPLGTVVEGSALAGPTLDDPLVTKTFDSSGAGEGTGVSLDFGSSAVTSPGVTTTTVSDSGPTVTGFTFATNPPTYYYLHTTATFTGQVEVCVYYDPAVVTGGPFSLLHYVNGAWVTLPNGPNWGDGSACGLTDSFSPFVMAKTSQVTLTKVSQCLHGGWATSTNPVFKSQVKCITYVALHQHAIRQVIKAFIQRVLHHVWY
jgi:hypothetical protein